MQTYYLILRDDPSIFANISPSDMQAIVQRYVNWRESNAGKVVGGQKLADGSGRVMRKRGEALSVSDGPFVEAKEVLGGFFVVQAESYDAAQAIANTCPHLEFGSIELRRMEPTEGPAD
jgi:hypothetical protein